jgi:predicted nucleic acid-binding Zn ribbon protein
MTNSGTQSDEPWCSVKCGEHLNYLQFMELHHVSAFCKLEVLVASFFRINYFLIGLLIRFVFVSTLPIF